MKRFILSLAIIASGTVLTLNANTHDEPQQASSTTPQESPICSTDTSVCIQKERVTLNLLKYMLSQGSSIADIQQGNYKVDGKQLKIK